ncbi:MAG: hypothetical protein GF320_01810, partial [Armatimonadia bacterium]|nr:hypothetical protein [Armatimonadia bacterium]
YTARTFSSHRYESKLLNSYGHPVPVIAGKLQVPGGGARGVVLETDFSPAEDRLLIEMDSCYQVPELDSLRRTFIHSREGDGAFVVSDVAVFSEPQTYATALITRGQVERIDETTLEIYDFESALRVEIDASAAFTLSEERIQENAPVEPTRLGIALDEPGMEARVALRITPLEVSTGDALLPNGDFSRSGFFWSIPADGLASISGERAFAGDRSLHITDTSEGRGTNIDSGRVPVEAGRSYTLSGHVYHVSGSGVGMYVKYLDESGQVLNVSDERGHMEPVGTLEGPEGQWTPFSFGFTPPEGTAALRVWIHSYNGAVVEAFVDGLRIAPAD